MWTRRAAPAAVGLAASTTRTPAMPLDDLKTQLLGDWTSLAIELRPSSQKNADGSLKPFHLRRDFRYLAGDRFELVVTNVADPLGRVPLARILIRGQMLWRGEHPVAPGAQKVDFIADEAYEVTPLLAGFAEVLNQVASQGYARWEVGAAQSVFGKAFAPFGLAAGRHFMEYDLVHLSHDLLFWGARHVDGRGFDTEENRPMNLQIPLARRP
ncbi:hypothetical protein [Roseateles sp.]|uniref:hypothetical protein n=1 Tax=Roseateles sp. TaxID=1971397 RepID=UPI0025CCE47A|nr:hypothetical protein [Roseateles sp.]